jgi:hypothetical protein
LVREYVKGEGGAVIFGGNNFHYTILIGMLYIVEVLNIFHGLLELLLCGPINFNFLYFFKGGRRRCL